MYIYVNQNYAVHLKLNMVMYVNYFSIKLGLGGGREIQI